jgi:uncharacterized RDD family membrane protein YckC
MPRRLLALLVDWFLISLLGWGLAFCITIFGFLTLGLGWVAFHIIPWLPLFYYTLFIGNAGATPGQRAAGLAVRQDDTLAPPTMAQALVWTLLLWLSVAMACLPLLLALFTPRNRTAHDVLSGLTVVRQAQITY